MQRAIVIVLFYATACRGERSTTKIADTTTIVTAAAPRSLKVDTAAVDTTSKPISASQGPGTSVAGDTLGTPRMPTPQEMRDSAIAFARREPACAKAAPDSESRYFHGARPSREFFPGAFCFSLGGAVYAVTSSGAGFRLSAGEQPYPFTISVDEGFDMTFLGYRLIGSRLYFLYEITDSEVGAGGLEAIDKNTLRPVWAKPVRMSFNMGDPLIVDSVAYTTGINEVGKVRLSDGKFIWKHIFVGGREPLPQGALYNAFDTPVLENGRVRFIPDSATSRSIGELVIDDKSGVVIAPEMIKGQKPACTGEQPFC